MSALGALLGVAAGIVLFTSRSKGAAIFATVAAVFLLFTCVGLIATIAVPILLWTSDTSKAWFAPQPQITPPMPPAPQ